MIWVCFAPVEASGASSEGAHTTGGAFFGLKMVGCEKKDFNFRGKCEKSRCSMAMFARVHLHSLVSLDLRVT